MFPDGINQSSYTFLIFLEIFFQILLMTHSLFISLLLAVYDDSNFFSNHFYLMIGSDMALPWTLSRTFWAAFATIEITAGRKSRIRQPLTNLTACNFTNVAHLVCLSKISASERCSNLVSCVLAVLFNLFFVTLPVSQVHLGHIELRPSIFDGNLRSLCRFFKVLTRFQHFPRKLETHGTFTRRYYVFLQSLNTADRHIPGKFCSWIGILRRNVYGRVVEGKILVERQHIFLESFNTKRNGSVSECAHQNEPVFRINSKDLCNSVIDIFGSRLKFCFCCLNCQKNIVYITNIIEERFKFLDSLVINCQALGVSETRSINDPDVESVVDIIDVVLRDLRALTKSLRNIPEMVLVYQLPSPVVSELYTSQLINKGIQKGCLSRARFPDNQKSVISDRRQFLAFVVKKRQNWSVQFHSHTLKTLWLRLQRLLQRFYFKDNGFSFRRFFSYFEIFENLFLGQFIAQVLTQQRFVLICEFSLIYRLFFRYFKRFLLFFKNLFFQLMFLNCSLQFFFLFLHQNFSF